MLYFFMVAHKMHAKPCRRPSWSPWRHGRGLADAEDIFLRGFVGWRSAMWCSFLLWSPPVLQRWSSLLVVSICSVWYLAWLCLGDWWGYHSVVLTLLQVAFLGSVVTKDWVHGVGHSPVCQILLQNEAKWIWNQYPMNVNEEDEAQTEITLRGLSTNLVPAPYNQ